jgi:hypothetical protein
LAKVGSVVFVTRVQHRGETIDIVDEIIPELNAYFEWKLMAVIEGNDCVLEPCVSAGAKMDHRAPRERRFVAVQKGSTA